MHTEGMAAAEGMAADSAADHQVDSMPEVGRIQADTVEADTIPIITRAALE